MDSYIKCGRERKDAYSSVSETSRYRHRDSSGVNSALSKVISHFSGHILFVCSVTHSQCDIVSKTPYMNDLDVNACLVILMQAVLTWILLAPLQGLYVVNKKNNFLDNTGTIFQKDGVIKLSGTL